VLIGNEYKLSSSVGMSIHQVQNEMEAAEALYEKFNLQQSTNLSINRKLKSEIDFQLLISN
jgi:hypothetical protein